MVKKHIEKTVKDFIKAIKAKNIKIEVAFLFGSYAQNKDERDSDIDVAVISPDFGKDFFDECVMLKEISESVDFAISPRAYSVEEYRNAKKGEFLYQEIIKKGKLIRA